jgi:hypothetical protein
MRHRDLCTQVELCAAPILTVHSGDSGKDESSAETSDNGRVQTFVPGRAKEARSVDVACPYRGGGAAIERTSRGAVPSSLPCASRATIPSRCVTHLRLPRLCDGR